MYISKLFIDVKIPAVRHDLSSLNYFYNRMKNLSGGKDILYRIDNVSLEKTGYIQPVVLISEEKPVVNGKSIQAGYFSNYQTYKYDIPVRKGMVYKFFTKANPSVKIFFRHTDLDTEESWLKWMESESFANGFEILENRATSDGYITCQEKDANFLSVIFDGSLKITDESKFTKALHYGIGRGKKYGLGLLSVESFGCKNRNIAEEMKNSHLNNK